MTVIFAPSRQNAMQPGDLTKSIAGFFQGMEDKKENQRARALQGVSAVQELSKTYNITPEQRQKVVSAYEKGDANVLSQVFGEIQTGGYRPEIQKEREREEKRKDFELRKYESEINKLNREAEEYGKPYRETREGRKFYEQEQIKAGFKAPSIVGGLTKGEEAADRAFAKEYVDYVQKGGREKVNQAIKSLSEARDLLSTSDKISGPVVGALPQFVRSRISPESKKVQDIIQKAVQSDLKGSLGSQFTEREGQQLLERAYDPSLSEEENARRMESVIQEIIARRDAMDEASQRFGQMGTLKTRQQGAIPQGQNLELQRLQYLRQKAGR